MIESIEQVLKDCFKTSFWSYKKFYLLLLTMLKVIFEPLISSDMMSNHKIRECFEI